MQNSKKCCRTDRTMSVRATKRNKRAMAGRRMAEEKIERDDEGKIR